ncbi:MAG: serine/threonine protein kinase, partial [Gemmataceae bacterium]|nr:serine/threonine protein kinase [Gemmataceae bacterium]
MSLRDASVDSSAVDIADRPTAVVRSIPSLPPKSGRVSQAALNAARAAFSLPEGPIGPYRIVREIGRGGMGIVYEAVDDRLKRRAAIKMVRFGVGISDEAMRRFQTEAEAVAKLGHPNIVQIYDIGRHQHQPFVALEYLPGGTLHSRVGNRPQPPRDAAALVQHLALAVQHAHECGVIHRDLKPANILFAEDDTPKI